MTIPRTDSLSAFASQNGKSAQESDPAVLIRTARQQDLEDLTGILADSFHRQDGWFGLVYPLLKLGIYEDLRTRVRSKAPFQACLVAVDSGSERQSTLTGTVEIALKTNYVWQPRNVRYVYLSNLAVRADYRRRGVALQLLNSCERIALGWGFQDLYLHVLENNHAARRLYLQAGYHLKQVDAGIGSWLMGKPRQLFLHKRLQPLSLKR